LAFFLFILPEKTKNNRQEKGYPKRDQSWQAEFNELLFIFSAVEADRDFRRPVTLEIPPPIIRKNPPQNWVRFRNEKTVGHGTVFQCAAQTQFGSPRPMVTQCYKATPQHPQVEAHISTTHLVVHTPVL